MTHDAFRASASSKRWIVRPGDGDTVEAVVALAGGDARAIADGRVFLGRKRVVRGDDAVRPGDEIVIAKASAAKQAAATVLLATPEIVAVAKPAGVPTIPDHGGSGHALIAMAARAIGVAPSGLHATSRLDRDVSGVVVFARSKLAADKLADARRQHAYVRRYVAIAACAPSEPSPEIGAWDAPIGRAKDPRHRAAFGKDAAEARTLYRVVDRAGRFALLAVAPITGRTHQIRVHASHAGAPLVGDRVYGGPRQITLASGVASGRVLALARIALHAARVTAIGHTIDAPVPDELRAIWESLGGDAAAWDRAVSCSIDGS